MDNTLKNDLINTKQLLDGNVLGMPNFTKYSSMYIFTNENIKGIMNNVDFYKKDVLLVCSSGDHIFNALLYNPANIVAYDINNLTQYMFDLKKAAILELSTDEFLNFFFISKFIKSKTSFNKDTYNRIKINLSISSRKYWDYIFNNYTSSQICNSCLFNDNSYSKKVIKNINPYLVEKNYLRLREILRNFKLNFINSDIFSLSDKLDNKFDYIYLSNIVFYFENKNVLSKLKHLILNLQDYLKLDGKIGVVYLYNYMDEYFLDCTNDLYNPHKRDECLSGDDYSYSEFPSPMYQKGNISTMYVDYQNRDAVLTLRKSSKSNTKKNK